MIDLEKLKQNTYSISSFADRKRKDSDANVVIPKEVADPIINEYLCPYIGPGINDKFIELIGSVSDPFLEDTTNLYTEITKELLFDEKIDKNGCIICEPKEMWIDMTRKFRISKYKENPNDIFAGKKGAKISEGHKEKLSKFYSKRSIREYKRKHNLMNHKIGIVNSNGDYVIAGQRNLKDKIVDEDGNLNEKSLRIAKFTGDIDDPDHITNLKTIYAGNMKKDQIEGFLSLLNILVDEIESKEVKPISIVSKRYLYLEREYKKGKTEKNQLNIAYNEGRRLYGELLNGKLTRNKLLNPKVHINFEAFTLSDEFIDFYNARLNEYIDNVAFKVTKAEKKLGKARLDYKEKITSERFYEIKKILTTKYIQTNKSMSMITLDIDLEGNDRGRIKLAMLHRMCAEMDSITVRNRIEYDGTEKLNHCTVYIFLGDIYKREDIDYLMKGLKLLGFNDLKHTYYIGKNPWNYKRFQSYKSNSNRTVFEALNDKNSIIYKAFYQIICNYYAVNGNLYDDSLMLPDGSLALSMREAINKCWKDISIIKDNKEKEEKIFFYCDEYDVFRKVIAGIDGNYEQMDFLFNNWSFKYRYKKDERLREITFKNYQNTEIHRDYKKIERKLEKHKYKKIEPIYTEELTDCIYEDLNHGYSDVHDKLIDLKEIKKKVNINYLKEDFIEINDERRKCISDLSFIAGSGYYFKCTAKEWGDWFLNHVHVCNSDNKYTNYQIKEIAMNGFLDGEKKIKDLLKESGKAFSPSQQFCSNLNKSTEGLLKSIKTLYDSLYYQWDEKTLNSHLYHKNKEIIYKLKEAIIDNDKIKFRDLIFDFFIDRFNKNKYENYVKNEIDKRYNYIKNEIDNYAIELELKSRKRESKILNKDFILNWKIDILNPILSTSVKQFSLVIA